MKNFGVTTVLLPTLVLASLSAGEAQVRQVLQPDQLCGDQPDAAIATFEDTNLEAAVRAALSVGAQEDLTCGPVSRLRTLTVDSAGIESLVGIQNLAGMAALTLRFNPITDISALSGLTSLSLLWLNNNSITDISALSGTPNLGFLRLQDNSITDISPLSGTTSLTNLSLNGNPALSNIQPLLDNTGLGAGDQVNLNGTNVSCPDVAALRAKGVTVYSPC